jgi:hypothetical protein
VPGLYLPQTGRFTRADDAGYANPFDPQPMNLYGYARFSAVGPGQATGIGALGIIPPNNSLAISPAIFGLPHNTVRQRIATQTAIRSNMANITISAPDLAKYRGTGGTIFTIGDVGDRNIRNSVTPRFDIYRYSSMRDALAFGIQTARTTVSGIPNSWSCPQ